MPLTETGFGSEPYLQGILVLSNCSNDKAVIVSSIWGQASVPLH